MSLLFFSLNSTGVPVDVMEIVYESVLAFILFLLTSFVSFCRWFLASVPSLSNQCASELGHGLCGL